MFDSCDRGVQKEPSVRRPACSPERAPRCRSQQLLLVTLAARQFLTEHAVVEREDDALAVGRPDRKLGDSGAERQSCGPASPRQIEQPQVGLRRVLRIRARCDRPSAVRGKRHAAKAARFRGAAGHSALPVEPGELGIGVSGAVDQHVVGGGRERSRRHERSRRARPPAPDRPRAPAASHRTAAPSASLREGTTTVPGPESTAAA